MQILVKTLPLIIALMLLAAIADVIIFRRADTIKVLRERVASIPRRVFELAAALLTGLALLGLLIMIGLLVSDVASTARYLWAAPAQSHDGLTPKDQVAVENALRANRIQVVTIGVQALGGIAVLIGIYFAWANLKITQRGQKETLRLTTEGQITDRFTKAIDHLGSSQLEIRLGGIYALERIARDSEKDRWPIMEVLTTYVRVHAPVRKTAIDQSDVDGAVPQLAPDIQAILTVIGRRERMFEKGKAERLNLSNSDLRAAHLLEETHLEDVDLHAADLTGSRMIGVHLARAVLVLAHLERVDMRGAHLEDANLKCASLAHTYLDGAHLERADFEGAHLEDVSMGGAYVEGTNFGHTSLQDVVPYGVHGNPHGLKED